MSLLIALSGALGCILRLLISRLAARIAPQLPLGTLLVNWSGSLLTGAMGGAIARHIPSPLSSMLLLGFLGGFTTFSTLTYESAELLHARELLPAVGNLALSVGGGAALALLGAMRP